MNTSDPNAMAGSHHGDPTITNYQLDVLLATVTGIKNKAAELQDPTWLPTELDEALVVMPRDCNDEQCFRIVVNMISWIRTVRRQKNYDATWFPGKPDMMKSRLFWRLRSGKNPLPSPPPTAFSCPWYEVVEEQDRPHWVYDCYIHRPGEVSPWGDIKKPIANMGQCGYEIEEWADEAKTIPSLVSFGPYTFKAFLGPYETSGYNTTAKSWGKITIEGWWLQCITPI